ncbi:MAG TPA: RES family NAD+ phosphorylase [Thermodesulfovibrionia bacterium]|nr:RES family NAD+ phosphorylase [Thermodesulfovibrionia bacterium]
MENSIVFYRLVKHNRVTRDDILKSRYGRFNYEIKNGTEEPMTYLADTIETAWQEISAHFGLIKPNPEVFKLYRITFKDLILEDLTNDEKLNKLGISEKELRADPVPPQCKDVAKKLRQEGFDGAFYRSVRNPKGRCLVLFIKNINDKMEIISSDDEWKDFIRQNL